MLLLFLQTNIELLTVILFGHSSGLARKEDFPYITYYCPHCHALNRPKQSEGHISSSSLPINPLKSEGSGDAIKNSSGSMVVATSNSPVRAGSEIEEVAEKVVSSDVVG